MHLIIFYSRIINDRERLHMNLTSIGTEENSYIE
jgi:hypothetical protein